MDSVDGWKYTQIWGLWSIQTFPCVQLLPQWARTEACDISNKQKAFAPSTHSFEALTTGKQACPLSIRAETWYTCSYTYESALQNWCWRCYEQHPSLPRMEVDAFVQVTVHTYIPYIPCPKPQTRKGKLHIEFSSTLLLQERYHQVLQLKRWMTKVTLHVYIVMQS